MAQHYAANGVAAGTNEKGHASAWPFKSGSPTRTRTWDLRINSPSLYQLSYQGIDLLRR